MSATDDPFDLLNLPAHYALDPALLRSRLLALSAQHHPDRFSDPFEQAEAAERISRINAAHRVLGDPLRRAEALLTRLAPDTPGDEKSLPPGFLMETLEIREALDDAKADNDQATLDRLNTWAETQRQEALDQIERIFARDAAGHLPATDAGQIRLQLNVLRYLARMLEAARS